MSEQLQEAVEKAAADLESQDSKVDAKTDKTETDKTENTKTEEEEPVLDKKTQEALELYDALNDPKRAASVVLNMMKQLGLQPETKKEEAKAERTIRDLVKEELGSDYAFLSDKIGTAIEKALQVQEQKFLEVERSKESQRAAKEYETFIAENKVTDEEAGELMKLVDKMPWSGKGALAEYLGDILDLHRSKVSRRKSQEEIRQKQQKNLEQRPKTLGVEANEDRISRGSKNISVKEAVMAAARGEKLD